MNWSERIDADVVGLSLVKHLHTVAWDLEDDGDLGSYRGSVRRINQEGVVIAVDGWHPRPEPFAPEPFQKHDGHDLVEISHR